MTDHLGSTEALTDATGKVVSSTSYDSFGNSTSNISTSYRYTGREYDSETGLYYYRNRWYDPEIGRFISEDPIGFAGGDINLYGYVGNSPYGFIDPYGFWRCSPNDPPGWWDAVQVALDVAGLTPVVGLPADLLNAGISVARGNYVDASLSMAAAVPVLGTAAGAGKIAHKASKLAKGASQASRGATGLTEKVKYIGRLKDLKNIPRSQTFLDELPNLGNPKANYYQNMSVLRKAIREGYTIKDASWFRPNSQLAPTLLRPDRKVGQTFLGAERLLLKNRGLWP